MDLRSMVVLLLTSSCGGRTPSGMVEPGVGVDADAPAGCFEVDRTSLSLGSDQLQGMVVVEETCRVSLWVTATLDDPGEAFEVDPPYVVVEELSQQALTVGLLATEPGTYEAQLMIEADGSTQVVQLSGHISSEGQ